jgi:hypothetical protein
MAYEHVEFAQPPPGWRWIRWRPVRWTGRRSIAEEHHWRAGQHGRYGSGWEMGDRQEPSQPASDATGADLQAQWPPDEAESLEADQIAGLYRALRKGRED